MAFIDLNRHSIARYLRLLREDRRIYIARHIGTKGEPHRVYAVGNLPDAEYVPLRPPLVIKKTRRKDEMMRQAFIALSKSPLTARQMGELLNICHNRASVYIAMLRRAHPGRIYIKGYKPAPGQGQPAPIYALASDEDAREVASEPVRKEPRQGMERKCCHANKKKQPASWLSALEM